MELSRNTKIREDNEGYLIYKLKYGAQVFALKNEMNDDFNYLVNHHFDKITNKEIRKIFLYDSNMDEVAEVLATYYTTFFDSSYLSFILMPNNICNFNCIYCYQSHNKKFFSQDTIKNFIKAVKVYHFENGLKKFRIEWFGGEPMMSFDMIKKITLELKPFLKKIILNMNML